MNHYQNAGLQLHVCTKELKPLGLLVFMGISNTFTYATIWNPSKLFIFRLTYCRILFNLYRILIILSLCHSLMGLIIIHHGQSMLCKRSSLYAFTYLSYLSKTDPYKMKTNTEFNKASCSESGKVISLATAFDLSFIYKMQRDEIP